FSLCSSTQASLIVPQCLAQVVGWPPIRSYRKNTMATNLSAPRSKDEAEAKQTPVPDCLYVKVSMDGAPYLRKVDLKMYKNYKDLSLELEKKFSGFTVGHGESTGKSGRDGLSDCRLMDLKSGTELVLTYEDKDGDWMLVGDVPWR
uniref:Auxin-responsive protein n=1 Tax=Aegilops tauschii subsp. strangulata TaxID=200361 RepID=A0A453S7W0_AEGTS